MKSEFSYAYSNRRETFLCALNHLLSQVVLYLIWEFVLKINLSVVPCFKESFSHQSYLNYHLRTHTSEKLYICSLCSNSFNNSRILNIHLRIHTCEQCGGSGSVESVSFPWIRIRITNWLDSESGSNKNHYKQKTNLLKWIFIEMW